MVCVRGMYKLYIKFKGQKIEEIEEGNKSKNK